MHLIQYEMNEYIFVRYSIKHLASNLFEEQRDTCESKNTCVHPIWLKIDGQTDGRKDSKRPRKKDRQTYREKKERRHILEQMMKIRA